MSQSAHKIIFEATHKFGVSILWMNLGKSHQDHLLISAGGNIIEVIYKDHYFSFDRVPMLN